MALRATYFPTNLLMDPVVARTILYNYTSSALLDSVVRLVAVLGLLQQEQGGHQAQEQELPGPGGGGGHPQEGRSAAARY